MIIKNFQPRPLNTAKITVAVTSQNTTLQCQSGRNNSVRVHNATNGLVFVEFFHTTGGTLAASATTSMPIAAGATDVFQVGVSESGLIYPYVIAPTATGDVYFTPGEGS